MPKYFNSLKNFVNYEEHFSFQNYFMRSNAMDSVAEAYLEAVRLKLEQIAEIMENNVNVDFKEPPSYEEQRKAMANR